MLNFYMIDQPDMQGITKENTIFYCLIGFVIVKWYRRYSMSQFFASVFFTIKLSLITSYFFVDFRVSIAYISACLAIWLLFKQPQLICETNSKEISELEDFEKTLGVSFKETEEGDVID
jgi:hypothetical protein